MINLEWCHIPAGDFLMGSEETSDNPAKVESTDAYLMAKYPVTNIQYAQFLKENSEWRKGEASDDHVDSDYLNDWDGDSFPKDKENYPVAWVSWHATVAFCEWLSRTMDKKIFLPTEMQWEKACRGTDGMKFPWGNDINEPRANCSSQSAPVGRTVDGRIAVGNYSPHGDSPYGCVDMAGNVWEWCSNWTDEYEEEKTLRGGGWNFSPEFLHAYFRFGCDPCTSYNYIGFRCAALPDESN